MRMAVHHMIGKTLCRELRESGCGINEKLFLLGNLFPDLIHSYLWCRHEYQHSRGYIQNKLDKLKKKPFLFSFQMGVLTHYFCDYFCYPHSDNFNKGLVHHILYEIRQKVPKTHYKIKLKIPAFSIEALDTLVKCYDDFRVYFDHDEESDFHIASMVASNFLQAVY